MEDEAVIKLVKLIFIKKFTPTSETIPPDSSLPASLQMNDFWWRIRYVMFMREFSIKRGYESFFDSHRHDMLGSHHKYLCFLLKSCFSEHACNTNIFDSFISVCCLVGFCNSETLKKAGVNFCDLNSDIVMEFYHNVLKKAFIKGGGFRRLVEYIRHHRYLEWKWDRNDLVSPDGSSSPVNFDTIRKLKEEMVIETKFQRSWQHRSEFVMRESFILAQKVLLTTSVELPTLPSREELIKKEVASRKKKIAEEGKDILRFQVAAELEAIEEIRKGCPSSNSDSATKNVAEAIEDFARYQDIIQAVITHNRCRISVLVNSDDSILEKANRILDLLKDRIKSIIEVLDGYDKE